MQQAVAAGGSPLGPPGRPERRGARPGPRRPLRDVRRRREAALRLRRTRADPGLRPDPRAGRRPADRGLPAARRAPSQGRRRPGAGLRDRAGEAGVAGERGAPPAPAAAGLVARARPAGGTRRAPGAAARRAGCRAPGRGSAGRRRRRAGRGQDTARGRVRRRGARHRLGRPAGALGGTAARGLPAVRRGARVVPRRAAPGRRCLLGPGCAAVRPGRRCRRTARTTRPPAGRRSST